MRTELVTSGVTSKFVSDGNFLRLYTFCSGLGSFGLSQKKGDQQSNQEDFVASFLLPDEHGGTYAASL
jgi:hypothetical protein